MDILLVVVVDEEKKKREEGEEFWWAKENTLMDPLHDFSLPFQTRLVT